MARARRNVSEPEPPQQLANRALVIGNIPAREDQLPQVNAAPAHHGVALDIRTGFDQRRQLGFLLRRQPPHRPRRLAVEYPDAKPAELESHAALLERGMAGLPAIRAALLARAESLGAVSRDPDLHLLIDGTVVRGRAVTNHVHRFTVPVGARDVVIASRSAVPTESVSASSDRRRLGVPLEIIVLQGAGLRIEIDQNCPSLTDGFHQAETTHRWTNGQGRVPAALLAPFAEDLTIELRIGTIVLHYPASVPADTAVAHEWAKSQLA